MKHAILMWLFCFFLISPRASHAHLEPQIVHPPDPLQEFTEKFWKLGEWTTYNEEVDETRRLIALNRAITSLAQKVYCALAISQTRTSSDQTYWLAISISVYSGDVNLFKESHSSKILIDGQDLELHPTASSGGNHTRQSDVLHFCRAQEEILHIMNQFLATEWPSH